MTPKANALGDYLRARRQQVHPDDVGLVPGARRRVEGLRREELAMLAGISAEYYLRLEVGRDKNPSPQVVLALARALRLDASATRYMHRLAGLAVRDTGELKGARPLAELVDQFLMPAIVANKYVDVLAANPLARALSPEFTPGQNFLRWRLLDPAARQLYVDWEEVTDSAVSGFRGLSGLCPNDVRVRGLVAELSAVSPRFRELWGRADVGYHRMGIHHMCHPQVGELLLYRNRLDAPGPDGDHVLMYSAEPGSDSARALEELRSLSASTNSFSAE